MCYKRRFGHFLPKTRRPLVSPLHALPPGFRCLPCPHSSKSRKYVDLPYTSHHQDLCTIDFGGGEVLRLQKILFSVRVVLILTDPG
jgi:hypothetical protein